jgi:competence protein ComEC
MPPLFAVALRSTARPFAWLAAQLAAERDRFAVWLPVFMGMGVLAYFSLRFEPPVWAGAAALLPALAGWVAGRRYAALRLILPPAIAACLGFTAGQVATARAPPPETGLSARAVIITGTLRAVEVMPEGRRITLGAARLDDAAPLVRTIRVRLRATDTTELAAGDTVRVRAIVRPPAPPAYPGAWDVQRDAFFAGHGGGGYALGPAQRLMHAAPAGAAGLVQALREAIETHIRAVIPGAPGAIAVTLLTGYARGIPEADHAAFRDSGLAHLLAVAGLHIGIVMGFSMGLARLAFAMSEHASLFWPTKQLAAVAALAAGAGYMVLTGAHVPIVRSFCMASLFTLALLSGRRPASLRGLAVAAVALLLLEPQELPGVSMQMSFSAVLALISGYETLRPWLRRLHGAGWRRRAASHLVALALTSALAGTASLPYGAYHFGHIQLYYVVANMVAVPLTAVLVMPLGMIALPLMPLGLDWLALRPMGWGIQAILLVAHATGDAPAATLTVPHMPAWGLAVLSAGIAWLGIWRGRLRLIGLAAIALGSASPALDRPPDLLVSADARLIGVRTPAGVFIQQTAGGTRFTRDSWLQFWAAHDAAPMPRQGEAADGAVACTAERCRLRPRAEAPEALLVRNPARMESCRGVAAIVAAEPARRLCPRPWPKLVDRFTVWRDGAAAVWLEPGGARVLTDRMMRGARPWVPPPPEPRHPAAPNLPLAPVDR